MMSLNRPALVLALLGAGCLSAFAQDGGTLEIAIVPTLSDTTTGTDPLADLSVEERESLLTKASIEAGYGEPYPADNPEAMAIIYDYAVQMLAASDAVAKEEIIPVDGEVIITETGEIVPKEEMIYTMTSIDKTNGTIGGNVDIKKNNGSVGGDVDIKNRFGQTVRSLAAALKMYDADRRAGIGLALSREVEALLASLKKSDAAAGRLESKTIGGFDRAMLSGTSSGDLVIDIRETTTGLDVDYRHYGPGQTHWGSASFAGAPGDSKIQTWFQECAKGKNIRKNISVTKVNWANIVIEKNAVQDQSSSAKFSKYGSTVFEASSPDRVRAELLTRLPSFLQPLASKARKEQAEANVAKMHPGNTDSEVGTAIEALARVSSLLEALAAQTGNDTLLEVAAALQEQVKLRQGLKIGVKLGGGILDRAIAHELTHVIQQRKGVDLRTAAHEAAHVVQQRTGGDEVWNQPLRLTEKKGPNAVNVKLARMAQEGNKGVSAVNVKLSIMPAPTDPTFDTLTNVQKSKHDAVMATIQNTR